VRLENDDHPPFRPTFLRRFQCGRYLGWMMTVIIKDKDISFFAFALESSCESPQVLESLLDYPDVQVQFKTNGGGGQGLPNELL
jgi:hypothetical protein